MGFMDEIRNKAEELNSPINMINFRRNKLVDFFKHKIQEANDNAKREVYIWKDNMLDTIQFEPNKNDLINSFHWFTEENVDYEYKWDNYNRDFVLKISW